MDLSIESLRLVIGKMIILILSIAVHEFGHAFVADRLGDGTPRSYGRVTLNPIAHADPIGTLLIPGLALLFTGGQSMGFGWGKPVPVNPMQFTRKMRMKHGHLLVAVAGPMMNILFGLFIGALVVILARNGVFDSHSRTELGMLALWAGLLNFILAFFNLLPAPPLDGGHVLQGMLPDRYHNAWASYAQYSMFVVMAFMFSYKLAQVFVWPAQKLYFGWLGILGLG